MTEQKNLPIETVKHKSIKFSVFKNKREDGSDSYSIQFQRSYKKKNASEWTRETVNMYAEDLPILSSLALITFDKILKHSAQSQNNKQYTQPDGYDPTTGEFNDEVPF